MSITGICSTIDCVISKTSYEDWRSVGDWPLREAVVPPTGPNTAEGKWCFTTTITPQSTSKMSPFADNLKQNDVDNVCKSWWIDEVAGGGLLLCARGNPPCECFTSGNAEQWGSSSLTPVTSRWDEVRLENCSSARLSVVNVMANPLYKVPKPWALHPQLAICRQTEDVGSEGMKFGGFELTGTCLGSVNCFR